MKRSSRLRYLKKKEIQKRCIEMVLQLKVITYDFHIIEIPLRVNCFYMNIFIERRAQHYNLNANN